MNTYLIGTYVELQCRVRNNHLFRTEDYETVTIKGTVVKPPYRLEIPAVCLRTDDELVPVRVIANSIIVGGIAGSADQISGELRAYDTGEYIVTKFNGKVSCTCVGFQFRRYCKHSDQYKEQLH